MYICSSHSALPLAFISATIPIIIRQMSAITFSVKITQFGGTSFRCHSALDFSGASYLKTTFIGHFPYCSYALHETDFPNPSQIN